MRLKIFQFFKMSTKLCFSIMCFLMGVDNLITTVCDILILIKILYISNITDFIKYIFEN